MTVCTAVEVLCCSARTGMTRGACTTPACGNPGTTPARVPYSTWLHWLCPNNLALVTSFGSLVSWCSSWCGCVSTKAAGVPPCGVASSHGLSGYWMYRPVFLFPVIIACAVYGETKLFSTFPPIDTEILGVVSRLAIARRFSVLS